MIILSLLYTITGARIEHAQQQGSDSTLFLKRRKRVIHCKSCGNSEDNACRQVKNVDSD